MTPATPTKTQQVQWIQGSSDLFPEEVDLIEKALDYIEAKQEHHNILSKGKFFDRDEAIFEATRKFLAGKPFLAVNWLADKYVSRSAQSKGLHNRYVQAIKPYLNVIIDLAIDQNLLLRKHNFPQYSYGDIRYKFFKSPMLASEFYELARKELWVTYNKQLDVFEQKQYEEFIQQQKEALPLKQAIKRRPPVTKGVGHAFGIPAMRFNVSKKTVNIVVGLIALISLVVYLSFNPAVFFGVLLLLFVIIFLGWIFGPSESSVIFFFWF